MSGISKLLDGMLKYAKRLEWTEVAKSLAFALVLAAIFRSFFFEFYKIPSGSMIPTLRAGDYLFISKYNYGYSKYSFWPLPLPLFEGRIFSKQPQRGDIIIFMPPGGKAFYIKRLIGLPGDEIQIIHGILYINGNRVPKIPMNSFVEEDKAGRIITHRIYEETLPNGMRYQIMNSDLNMYSGELENTPLYKVPQGHYFFMGDNRSDSKDSRTLEVGYVPEANLVGRPIYMVLTSDLSISKLLSGEGTGRAFRKFQYAN